MFPKNTRFLTVDDSALSRTAARTALEELGYSLIIGAESVSDAKEILNKRSTIGQPVQCIILDINMPFASGLVLVEWVRKTDPFQNLPIVVLTGNRSVQDVREAVRLGASSYCTKPLDTKVLEDRLKGAWVRHGQAFFKSLDTKAG